VLEWWKGGLGIGMGDDAAVDCGSSSCIRRSTRTVAFFIDTLDSRGCKCSGIDKVSDGPTGWLGGSYE
jgi:hypothetical protein